MDRGVVEVFPDGVFPAAATGAEHLRDARHRRTFEHELVRAFLLTMAREVLVDLAFWDIEFASEALEHTGPLCGHFAGGLA